MGIFNYVKKIFGGDNIVNFSDIRYLPRWVILAIDTFILILSIFISYHIINKLHVEPYAYLSLMRAYVLIVSINVVYMFVFKTYAGIIRHSTFEDLIKLFFACLFTFFTLGTLNFSTYWFTGNKMLLTPFLPLYFAISLILLFIFRLFVKEFFHLAREVNRNTLKNRILVLGIGEASIAVVRAIIDNPNLPYHVVGFLTQRDDSKKARLFGKKIFYRSTIENNAKEYLAIDGVLIIKEMMSKEDMNSWVNLFLEKDLKIYKAPSLQKIGENDLGGSIKNLQIEDLLNRKPIKIENDEVNERHCNKNILISGGAGSIGSELVRQVSLLNPALVVVLDQAETPLYDIELELREKFPHINFKFVLGDISNRRRLEPLFEKYSFAMVYHAAAYKHVPLVEENPHEGVLVNIYGTRNLATLSSQYGVKRFVMVSTDKAVNPTNVMGATKRVAELFVQALQNVEGNKTKFITTRFGNVLGSNGSVIPLFKKQIENGGPITITHPDIVRYFMTIPEACELVLQAGTMGEGGEIFVFDMGEPIKILDLARRMIKLSGLEPETDIKISYTGLRPGEKLYEELLSDNAKNLPTHNKKIMISKDPHLEFAEIESYTNLITKASLRREKREVVRLLKVIVPEFISNNSIYESLDK